MNARQALRLLIVTVNNAVNSFTGRQVDRYQQFHDMERLGIPVQTNPVLNFIRREWWWVPHKAGLIVIVGVLLVVLSPILAVVLPPLFFLFAVFLTLRYLSRTRVVVAIGSIPFVRRARDALRRRLRVGLRTVAQLIFLPLMVPFFGPLILFAMISAVLFVCCLPLLIPFGFFLAVVFVVTFVTAFIVSFPFHLVTALVRGTALEPVWRRLGVPTMKRATRRFGHWALQKMTHIVRRVVLPFLLLLLRPLSRCFTPVLFLVHWVQFRRFARAGVVREGCLSVVIPEGVYQGQGKDSTVESRFLASRVVVVPGPFTSLSLLTRNASARHHDFVFGWQKNAPKPPLLAMFRFPPGCTCVLRRAHARAPLRVKTSSILRGQFVPCEGPNPVPSWGWINGHDRWQTECGAEVTEVEILIVTKEHFSKQQRIHDELLEVGLCATSTHFVNSFLFEHPVHSPIYA